MSEPRSTLDKMIHALRQGRYLASADVDETIWETEIEHRLEFKRFLCEIPHNFVEIAGDPRKRDLVRDHLKTFYRISPKDTDVQTVLDRITNLAAWAAAGGDREKIEDKALQRRFKAEHWKNEKRCTYCGNEFQSLDDVRLDHILPLSLGGAEQPSNWQLTCELCNQQKRNLWGISDLSRGVHIQLIERGFFSLSAPEIIPLLRAPNNPTRYWVFERDNRQCFACKTTTDNEKLYIGVKEKHFLPTIDNLVVYCADCAKRQKSPICE